MLHYTKELMHLIWDLVIPARPTEILAGKRMFRPFLNYQTAWLSHFYSEDSLGYTEDAWHYLQKYMMPCILKNASSYHVQGIELLGLNSEKKPNFETFKKRFYEVSQGFEIESVHEEILPEDYFYLISKKKFPCIKKLRSLDEIFCANAPDFWHEAIGHIAPLCFKEVQTFYLEIADRMLSAKKREFANYLALAWTVTEYGFLKENGKNKMFGAALVGSHLANMRFELNYIAVERAEKEAILSSGFYSEKKPLPRTKEGQLRYFCLPELTVGALFNSIYL